MRYSGGQNAPEELTLLKVTNSCNSIDEAGMDTTPIVGTRSREALRPFLRVFLPVLVVVGFAAYCIAGVKGIYWGLLSSGMWLWIYREISWDGRRLYSDIDSVREKKWISTVSVACLMAGLISPALIRLTEEHVVRSSLEPGRIALLGTAIAFANALILLPMNYLEQSLHHRTRFYRIALGWILACLFSFFFFAFYILINQVEP